MPQPLDVFAVDQRVLLSHPNGAETPCVVRGTMLKRCDDCGGLRYFLEQDDGGIWISCGNVLRVQSLS